MCTEHAVNHWTAQHPHPRCWGTWWSTWLGWTSTASCSPHPQRPHWTHRTGWVRVTDTLWVHARAPISPLHACKTMSYEVNKLFEVNKHWTMHPLTCLHHHAAMEWFHRGRRFETFCTNKTRNATIKGVVWLCNHLRVGVYLHVNRDQSKGMLARPKELHDVCTQTWSLRVISSVHERLNFTHLRKQTNCSFRVNHDSML